MDQHNRSQLKVTRLVCISFQIISSFQVFSIIKRLIGYKASSIIYSHCEIHIKNNKDTNINVVPELLEIVIVVILVLVVFLVGEVDACY
jgi:hypothetical protein